MSSGERESWSTRVGFILAAVGSAVGLGNVWRFPYMVAENGGAAFVLLFVVLLVLIGLPVMVAEFVLGRSSRKSPILALSQADEPDWSWLGLIFVAAGFTILSYYSVVGGWTTQYMLDSFSGHLFEVDPKSYFGSIARGHGAFMFHLLFMVLVTGIVLGGVKQGIETCVKALIPLLVLLIVGLAAWAISQPGSWAGLNFYLQPDLTALFATYSVAGTSIPFLDLNLFGDAAGQAFFTLSLGMGAMITYSSYLDRNRDLASEGSIISLADLTIALLAGLMVFPFLALHGMLEDSQAGPALFQSAHAAFGEMEYLGPALGGLFFLALLMAALTSGISLLEVVTSTVIDIFDLNRQVAASSSGLLIFLLGVPAAYVEGWLGVADMIAANVLLLFGGLMLVLYVGWLMSDPRKELRKGLTWPVADSWLALIRYVATPVLLVLFVQNLVEVLSQFGS